MSRKLTEYGIDLDAPRALTDAEQAEIEALVKLPDDTIDTSDIPELYESLWRNAERGRFYKPIKRSTTVRIDADGRSEIAD